MTLDIQCSVEQHSGLGVVATPKESIEKIVRPNKAPLGDFVFRDILIGQRHPAPVEGVELATDGWIIHAL